MLLIIYLNLKFCINKSFMLTGDDFSSDFFPKRHPPSSRQVKNWGWKSDRQEQYSEEGQQLIRLKKQTS